MDNEKDQGVTCGRVAGWREGCNLKGWHVFSQEEAGIGEEEDERLAPNKDSWWGQTDRHAF